MSRKPRLSFLSPEVIQTSGMDCGPAALSCFLRAAGQRISYPRLRELCQTDVDGTSIDTMEEIAVALGARVEQVVVPAHHLFEPETRAFPALAVNLLPDGNVHFVVLWRRVGKLVQIMDPAVGRRWVTMSRLPALLFRIDVATTEDEWLEWARGDEFSGPLRRRLTVLAGKATADQLLAARTGSARDLASLDGAARLLEELVASSALRRSDAPALLDALLADPDAIPASYRCLTGNGDEARLHGNVLLRLNWSEPPPSGALELDEDQRARLAEPPFSFAKGLWGLARQAGAGMVAFPFIAALIGAAVVGFEALVFRALIDLGRWMPLSSHRLAAVAAVAAAGGALLLIQVVQGLATRRLGRELEIRFRAGLLARLPHISDPYFRSRLASDMAERGHAVHRLRRLPLVLTAIVTLATELVITALALSWIAPEIAWLAWLSALGALFLAIIAMPALAERDLRLRGHSSTLARFYLDGLLGLAVLRAHTSRPLFLRQHEGLLSTWARAHNANHRLEVLIELSVVLWGLGSAALLLFFHVKDHGMNGGILLVAWWALQLPTLANMLARTLRQLPPSRTAAMTLLELFSAAQTEGDARDRASTGTSPGGSRGPAAALSLRGVSVVAGGHTVLHDLDVDIAAGEHVAVVGVSGAGKSSFLALLLGVYHTGTGEVRVDGERLEGPLVERLRRETAWVAPEVALWNQSLLDNLVYGHGRSRELAAVLDEAALGELIAELPEGLGSSLGEGGRLVSGGEGQRVRLGRGLGVVAPRLVLLDEALRGLDHAARRGLTRRIRSRYATSTLIFATHDIADTDAFDRVLVFADGTLAEDGAPQELAAASDSIYARLLARERELLSDTWESPEFEHWWMERGALSRRRGEEPRG